jgi:DNA-binding XRE family transcriptional regulator
MPHCDGYIYAIGSTGTSAVKIGSTRGSVKQRVSILQVGQPFRLQILASVAVDADVQRIEKQIHAFLDAERVSGEWFNIPMDTAQLEALMIRAIAFLAAEEGQQSSPQAAQKDTGLGTRICAARKRYGMSQTELARRIGITPSALYQIESGIVADPRVSRLKAIAEVLQITADSLLGLRHRPHDPTL